MRRGFILLFFGYAGKTYLSGGRTLYKGRNLAFCGPLLILIIFKIITWVTIFSTVGTTSQKQKQTNKQKINVRNYTKNKPFKEQELCGRKPPKTPEWFFLKRHGKANFISLSLDFHILKVSGGKPDDDKQFSVTMKLLKYLDWYCLNNFFFLLYFSIDCQRTKRTIPITVDNPQVLWSEHT